MSDRAKILEWIADAESSGTVPIIDIPKRAYNERLVAWIDTLAMRNKMRESEDAEEIFTIMSRLQNHVENACEELVASERLNYLQISDGFIIVADLDCINEVCEILCQIQWQVLFYSQMLLRGALTAGKVSMSEDSKLIIGPAFIEAFAMESENAIFPRILFANEIKDYIKKDSIAFPYLKEDSDHFVYLDFLKYMIDKEQIKTKDLKHLVQTQGVKELLIEGYSGNILKRKNVAQKHGWLIARFAEHKIRLS
jgi:hypothetical protein